MPHTQPDIQRWTGTARGRAHTVAHAGLVWTVSNALTTSADFDRQVVETLDRLDVHLHDAGSNRTRLLSVQVLLSDIAQRDAFDRLWCHWIGDDPTHWPQRACFQAALAPGLSVELIVVAAVA